MKQYQTNTADKMRPERMIADGDRLISPLERRKAEERKKRWNNLQQEWNLTSTMASLSLTWTVGYGDPYRNDQQDANDQAQLQADQQQQAQKERMLADGWPRWVPVAESATCDGLNQWLRTAEILTGEVDAAIATTPRGAFGSSYSFPERIASALVGAGMPSDLATWFSSAIGEVWRRWALSWKIPFLPLYPAFAAFPAAQAPPMPNVPFSLGAGVERLNPYEGERTLLPDYLSNTLYASSCEQVYPGDTSRNACNDFANWFSRGYFFLMGSSTVSNVLGWGPVPSFAPPYVPVGPVVGGTLRAMPGCVTGRFIG